MPCREKRDAIQTPRGMGNIAIREARCPGVNSNVVSRDPTASVACAIVLLARERAQHAVAHSASVELLQNLLYLSVFLLHGDQCLLNSLQALLLVRFVGRACLILFLPVVLNLFAAVFDLR